MSIDRHRVDLATGRFKHDILLLQIHSYTVSVNRRLLRADLEEPRRRIEVSRSLTIAKEQHMYGADGIGGRLWYLKV